MGKLTVMRPRPADIHPILVLNAAHQVDCLILCLKCLERFTDLARFKRVLVLARAGEGDLWAIASRFAARNANVAVRECPATAGCPWRQVTREEIFAEHRREVVVKLDSNVFVAPGWLEHLVEGYRQHAHLDDVALVSPLIPVSASGRRVLGRFLKAAYPSERHMFTGQFLEQDWVYHRWIWEKVVRDNLMETWLGQTTAPYHYLDEAASHCAIFDRRFVPCLAAPAASPTQDAAAGENALLTRAMQTGGLRGAVTGRGVAHHYSFPDCEDYLRGHVSLETVWRYTERLRVDPVGQEAPRVPARRPALRLLASGGLHSVIRA